MTRFLLAAVTVAALSLIPKIANAKTYIYKVDQSARAFLNVNVIDEIPQLGVIITRQQLPPQRGIEAYGEVGTVQLVQPYRGGKQIWGLRAIEATKAWETSKGEGVLVAVSDTGIDSDHPELQENIWSNPKEVAGNNVDDDGNGYVDDVHGWNFVKKRPSKNDNHYHGTHVAGTIAARAGDKISGVAPRAKLMDVAFLDSSGSGTDANGAKSIVYAADNGAKIINCSWGGEGKNKLIEEAVRYAESKGVLVVAAAGNAKTNIDRKSFYPAAIQTDNIISVAATASMSGHRADFSNWGKVNVDLAAPGQNIFSTAPSSGNKSSYQSLSGTSMASPHTAGVVALVWSKYPHLTAAQVKEKVLKGTVLLKTWKSSSVTSGLLNAANPL